MSDLSDIPTPTRQAQWPRFVIEGVVIVASILLAFGIEAWWGENRDRAEEREILSGLETEFHEYVQRLEQLRDQSDVALRRLRYLLDGEVAASGEIPADSLDSAFWTLMWAPTFDPGSGTRDALVSSGRLELIENVQLRDLLSSWQSLVDELRDNQLAVRSYVPEILVPYLSAQGIPLARPLSTVSFWEVHPDAPSEAKIRPKVPDLSPGLVGLYQQTVSDPEFQGLIAYRYFWEAGSSSEVREVLSAANEIVALIGRQSRASP